VSFQPVVRVVHKYLRIIFPCCGGLETSPLTDTRRPAKLACASPIATRFRPPSAALVITGTKAAPVVEIP
jgi:hypothetical protein